MLCSIILFCHRHSISDYCKYRQNVRCQYVQSNLGNPMLVIDGYRFCLQKKRSDSVKKRWRCSSQHARCKATAMTVNDTVVILGAQHNH
uniref:SFRICE_014281 n=1 Tax=Spodoptera frugiperda TaxID=7108 RepID=A0A2H1WPF0_SPOFR